MSVDVRPWYRRPWTIVAAVGFSLLGLGLIAFAANVVRYAVLIKSGKFDPVSGIRDQQLRASVSSRIANTHVTPQDLARLVPRTPVPRMGNPKAALQIVEFIDYKCPYSKASAPAVRAFMEKHATDTSFVLRDFPITELHPTAQDAAIAADCVFRIDPDAFWSYHDRIFASQDAQSANDLRIYASQLGVNLTKYDGCIRAKTPLNVIKKSIDDGLAVGVQGTPTFFFNGVKISGQLDEATLELIADQVRKSKS